MTGDVPRGSAPLSPGRPAAGREAGPPPILDQMFAADSLYALRAAVEAHASAAGMREGRSVDLVISIHELAANAVRHGAGTGRLQMWNRDGALHCQVSDDGAGDPRWQPEHGDPRPRADGGEGDTADDLAAAWPRAHGHGLWIVGQMADRFSLSSGPGGTIAAVAFALPAPEPRPPFRLTRWDRGGRTVLELSGDLDQQSARELMDAVRALTSASPAVQLVMDLTAMTFWDSSGIAALIMAQQQIDDSPQATMVITGLPGRFREQLHSMDVISQFTLADSAGP
ncbi:MAG: ATP-binding protein, partial [Streptosporangiaceae bacterium]